MKTLILGGPLNADGSELCWRTKARVDHALKLAKREKLELHTSAPFTDRKEHTGMTEEYGVMMQRYARENGDGDITYLGDDDVSFDTVGELRRFLVDVAHDEQIGLVSAGYHLPRICFHVIRLRGLRYAFTKVR